MYVFVHPGCEHVCDVTFFGLVPLFVVIVVVVEFDPFIQFVLDRALIITKSDLFVLQSESIDLMEFECCCRC